VSLGRQEKGERLCCPFYRERERRGRVGQGGNGRRLTPLHCLMASVSRREIMGGGRNGGVEAPLTARNRTERGAWSLGGSASGAGETSGRARLQSGAMAAVGRRLAGLRRAKSVQGAGSSHRVAGRPGARTGAGTVAASHGRGACWRERESMGEER
jgi:hypothetical protein